jgi:hypothetical protein
MASQKATKAALIADIQALNEKNPGNITRDFYRANSKFTRAEWQKFFPKFSDFLSAADITPKSTQPEEPETSEIVGDTWNLVLPKTRIHTLDQLLEYCEVDQSIWEVERFLVNKWEMGYKNKADKAEVEQLFQVKATLRRKLEVLAVREEIADLKRCAMLEAREPEPIERPVQASGNMLEVNIPDVHFGKLAWPVETGYEPYDTKIAAVTYLRAVNTLVDRVSGYKFDQIVYVVGNDIFNSDDLESRTTKGTVVTTDGRYHKTFYKVRHTITETIELLRKIAPVKVIMVPGNHDNLSVWHLGDSLECTFAKYPDVEIDNVPKYRKYHRFGNVMLMLTHGDKGKRTDYPLLMATEQPEMFGATKYREAHTGHTHMTKLDEQHGVRVRVLPALCPPDDWHSENGFVGNLRNAEAYIWNKDEGLIGMSIYSDNAQEPILTKREIVKGVQAGTVKKRTAKLLAKNETIQ